MQFPMISEFGEDTNSYCSFESKETALLHSENGNLQQRVNILTHEVRREMRTTGKDIKYEKGKDEEFTLLHIHFHFLINWIE